MNVTKVNKLHAKNVTSGSKKLILECTIHRLALPLSSQHRLLDSKASPTKKKVLVSMVDPEHKL